MVTGLDKTGDGGKFLPTMKAVAEMMRRFGADIESVADVQTSKNTAVVMLEAVIPDHGGREGELLDVAVTAVAAKSLDGGRLLPTPLVYHFSSVPASNIDHSFVFTQPLNVPAGTVTVSLVATT